MRRLPLLMLLGVFGCRGHSGFHSFSGGSSSFHSSSSISHAGSGGGSVHSSYRAPSSWGSEHGSGLAATAVRVLETAAEIALDSASDAEAPPEEEAALPPFVETPVTEVVWASTASIIARSSDCSAMSTVGVGELVLHRNTTLALYVVGTGDAYHAFRPVPEGLRLAAEVQGPANLVAGSMDGNRLLLVPNGPLGAPVHIEVINSNTGTRLALEIPTEESDAPCG